MTSSPRTLSVTKTDSDDDSRSGGGSANRRDSISSVEGELANGVTTPEEEPDGLPSRLNGHTNGHANGHSNDVTIPVTPAVLTGVAKFLHELAKHVAMLPTKTAVSAKNPAEADDEINLQNYFTELKQFSLDANTKQAMLSDDVSMLEEVDVDAISRLLQEAARIKARHKSKRIKLTDKQLFTLDQCELQLMRIALFQLNGQTINEPSVRTDYFNLFTKIGVFASILLGVIYSGAESFTGAADLFGGLLSIAEPITFGISIGFAVLSNLLFFGLEAKGFMVEAGISSPFSITRTVKLASQKLEVAKAFSDALRNPRNSYKIVNNLDLYRSNHSLLKVIQNGISTKLDNLKNPSGFLKTRVYPVLKSIFSISGAALFACGGVIIGKDLVANIAALSFGIVLSNPVAMIVIITLAVAGFSLFYALQHRGALDLFDAVTGRPRELLDAQKEFVLDSVNANQNVLTHIQNIDAKQRAFNRVERYQSQDQANGWMNTMMPAQRQTQSLRTPRPIPQTVTTNTAADATTTTTTAAPTLTLAQRFRHYFWAPIVREERLRPREASPVEPVNTRRRSTSI